MTGRCQRAVEQPAEADQIEQPGEHAFLGQDQLPAIDAHQIIRPERQHDRDIEHRLGPGPGEARHVIGERKGDGGAAQGHRRRHHHRAQDDGEIGRREQLGIGGERGLIDDEAGEIVDREEALGEQGQQRADIDDAEPEQRRQQQQEQHQPRPEIEEGGEPSDGAWWPAGHGAAGSATALIAAFPGYGRAAR